MSITTKQGDTGITTDGTQKIYKSSHTHYLMAVGKLDQLNSILGLILSKLSPDCEYYESIEHIQVMIVIIGMKLPIEKTYRFESCDFQWFDERIKTLEQKVHFEKIQQITGNEICCLFHLARTICREAELYVWDTIKFQPGKESIGAFMNRLSDLLYLFAEASK